MITKDNFKNLLLCLDFTQHNNQFSKQLNNTHLAVDFDKQILVYPDDLIINEHQTCNFSAAENFVVFECVHRLLEKGYKPEHIELEPKWQVGHGASGGRADILIKDNDGNVLLIIECKTAGNEFKKAWNNTLEDGGQLFGYAANAAPDFLSLYASDFDEKLNIIKPTYYLISLKDNDDYLKENAHKELASFSKSKKTRESLFSIWKETYNQEPITKGIFEPSVQSYHIGKQKVYLEDLQTLIGADIQAKYHEFATVLRQHNISGRENAFDKLINLFLCKIVDEAQNSQKDTEDQELKFYWKGIGYDSYFDLIDRLQQLYQVGMKRFLNEDVTYIKDDDIDNAFRYFKNDPDATRTTIEGIFKQLKYFTNSDFAFLDVHNESLFYQNSVVLLKIVQMLQDIKLLQKDQHNQFLGDLFEGFLDNGIKQSEGQFFTPMPICRFILQSLPLESLFANSAEPPKAIDYACGAGHFLNELAMQITPFVKQHQHNNAHDYYAQFYGIEKEYRLSKVAKVSAFMYGQDDINILYHDALASHEKIANDSFSLLVANPPYSVKGFLTTLDKVERKKYTLFNTIGDKSLESNNSIETFFIERAKQLLKSGGVTAIIVPSSILSNGDSTYTATRGLLLSYFDIVALCEFGSGTFGKTGTNTVTLFLRRKEKDPSPADHYRCRVECWFKHGSDDKEAVYNDEYVIKQYCQHIGIDFVDYQSLLAANPNAELLAMEIFIDYRVDFDKSQAAKVIHSKYVKLINNLPKTLTAELEKQQKDSAEKLTATIIHAKVKALLPEETDKLLTAQSAELTAKFLDYLQAIEKDKLYYFALAYHNPQKVLVVKSPSDNKEQKAFLGYEWSSAKGNEGIKLTTDKDNKHITPLYDANNRDNTAKINYYIAQNFLGNVFDLNLRGLEDLAGLVTTARLVDMLDFSRKDFNKSISLTPKKSVEIETKWELVKLEKLNSLLKRGKSTQYGNSKIQVIKSGQARGYTSFDFSEKYYAVESFVSDDRNLQKGDLLINSTGVGTAGRVTFFDLDGDFIADSHIAIFRPNEAINPMYLLCALSYLIGYKEIENMAQGSTGQIELTISTIENIKIPLPPIDIQQQIVADCEAIDSEVQTAEQIISNARREIETKILELLNSEYRLEKIGNLCSVSTGGTPSRKIHEYWNNGTIPWLKSEVCKECYVFEANEYITEEGFKKSNVKYFEQNTTLIALVGATKGKTAYLKFKATTNQNIAGIYSLNESVILNNFIYFVCRGMYQTLIENLGQYDMLNLTEIRNIKIPVPDSDIQKNLVAQIEQLENKIATAQKTINEAANKKQAVLKKYL